MIDLETETFCVTTVHQFYKLLSQQNISYIKRINYINQTYDHLFYNELLLFFNFHELIPFFCNAMKLIIRFY